MALITYPDKQTAADPNNPAANEVFTADDANMIKTAVNSLENSVEAVGGIIDPTTSDYTSAALNIAYPTAIIGQEVACPYTASGAIIYKKITATVWYSIPMGTTV
jgi:hypothetical protein